jgi:hypothetical protein
MSSVEPKGQAESRQELRRKVLTATVTAALSIVAGFMSGVATLSEISSRPWAVVVATIAVALLAAMTSILELRQRGPSRIVALRAKLEEAYLRALDESRFSPARREASSGR